MFKTIYADNFERSQKKRKGKNLSMLGDNPIDEVSNDSDESLKWRNSESSETPLSFWRKKLITLFDKMEPAEESWSSSAAIEFPIQEEAEEAMKYI